MLDDRIGRVGWVNRIETSDANVEEFSPFLNDSVGVEQEQVTRSVGHSGWRLRAVSVNAEPRSM